jgi:hypothetical protein
MAQGKRQVRGRREGRDLMTECTSLALLQPRRAGLCDTLKAYLSAPKLEVLSLEQIGSMSQAERDVMKHRQAQHWGRPWWDMAAALETKIKRGTQ